MRRYGLPQADVQPAIGGFRMGLRLSAERRDALVKRIDELAEEYAFADDEDGEPLGLSVVLHRRMP